MEGAVILTGWAAFGFGALGGVLVELVALHALRYELHDPGKNPHLKSIGFWVMVGVGALLGGGVAFAFADWTENNINRVLAIQIGAAWPLILQRLGSSMPNVEPGSSN